jgi:hypothetical protein
MLENHLCDFRQTPGSHDTFSDIIWLFQEVFPDSDLLRFGVSSAKVFLHLSYRVFCLFPAQNDLSLDLIFGTLPSCSQVRHLYMSSRSTA